MTVLDNQRINRAPYPPIPPAPSLIGRGELITQCVDRLIPSASVAGQTPIKPHLILRGAGGIGKTAIAYALIHHEQIKTYFGDRRFFFRCDTLSDDTSRLKCERLNDDVLKCIGPGEGATWPLRERFMSRFQNKFLVVFDNFETIIDEICDSPRRTSPWEDLTRNLASLSNVALLFTTRTSFAQHWEDSSIPEIEVPPLTQQDGLDLFMRISRSKFPPMEDLVNFVSWSLACLPLAIRTVAYSASDYGTIEEVKRAWRIGLTVIDNFPGSENNRESSVGASVSLSLNSNAFKTKKGIRAKALLYIMARITHNLRGGSLESLRTEVRMLAEMSLIELTKVAPVSWIEYREEQTQTETETEGYRILPPVKRTILVKWDEDAALAQAIYSVGRVIMSTYVQEIIHYPIRLCDRMFDWKLDELVQVVLKAIPTSAEIDLEMERDCLDVGLRTHLDAWNLGGSNSVGSLLCYLRQLGD